MIVFVDKIHYALGIIGIVHWAHVLVDKIIVSVLLL